MIIMMVTILKPLTLHHQFLHQHNKSLILFHPSNSPSKKGEYDIWAIKMEHYLSHTDYLIWKVIHNGNGHVSVITDTNGMIKVLPPKTTKEVVAKERFQTLLSQLEIHGDGVSQEDANQKFLRSLPSSWSQVALIMRTKPGLDTLSFDDLYNNLRVFEHDVKGGHNFHEDKEVSQEDRAKGNQDSIRRDVGYNRNKTRDNGRRPAYQDDSKELVTIDGEDINWSGHVKEDTQNYAMMAYSSSNSGFDNEVKSFSKACKESYAGLKKLYDEQRNKLGDASVEITAYTLGLKKASDLEDTLVNDRYVKGMHTVPPPMTVNYMPFGLDVKIDYSKFTYGPKQTSADESDSKPSEYASCESDSSVETSTSMPEPVEKASKVICEPKVWTNALIIEEYESDSKNDSVSNVQEDNEKPSFAFIDSLKHVKTSRENIKETGTTNHSPKIKKQDRNGHTRKGLGYAFTRKACFVCGSFSHLIKDCDFHEKRMSKQAELTKSKRNKAHLADYQEFKGGTVAFGGSNGRITGKGKIKAARLDFEDVYYVEELKHYNLFSVSHMCDKKNKVLICVASQKRKQHKAFCKANTVSSMNQPLQILHMDSFGPTSVRSINHKTYRLVITDGFSRIEPHSLNMANSPYELPWPPVIVNLDLLQEVSELQR
uniref:Ribonuclease H-like domain-containing protein n=1 Tax=Tanacetum cinerariifolium TaxID=118510 RepID=A0A6L2K453_TANCI|nr:ribonuclease H-like domain-containing protein [Tanacetum cinerariifolium]